MKKVGKVKKQHTTGVLLIHAFGNFFKYQGKSWGYLAKMIVIIFRRFGQALYRVWLPGLIPVPAVLGIIATILHFVGIPLEKNLLTPALKSFISFWFLQLPYLVPKTVYGIPVFTAAVYIVYSTIPLFCGPLVLGLFKGGKEKKGPGSTVAKVSTVLVVLAAIIFPAASAVAEYWVKL